jgi:O-antigen ligase
MQERYSIRQAKFTDYVYDIVMLLFVVFFVAFDNVRPAYVIIQWTFIILFLIRAITHNMQIQFYTYWSIVYLIIGLISTLFSDYISIAAGMLISVIQVLLVTNLLLPYAQENEANLIKFQNAVLIAFLALGIRYLIFTPFNDVLRSRAGSSIGYNANEFGFIFAYGTTIAVFLAHDRKSKLYLIIAILFGFLCLISGSRTAFAVMIIALAIYTVGFYRIKGGITRLGKGIFIFAILLIGVWVLIMNNEFLYSILGSRIDSFYLTLFKGQATEGSATTRVGMMREALGIFFEAPLLGHGLNSFRVISGYSAYSHNNYTELLVSIGLIGTTVYYILFLSMLFKSIKLFKKTKSLFYLCPIALVAAALIGDLGTVSYYSESLFIVWVICYLQSYTRKGALYNKCTLVYA